MICHSNYDPDKVDLSNWDMRKCKMCGTPIKGSENWVLGKDWW